MTKKQAFTALSSADLNERLAAAQRLRQLASSVDEAAIKSFLQTETSSWVRTLLEMVLNGLAKTPHAEVEELPIVAQESTARSAEIDRDIETATIERVTETLIHELSPIVGRLKVFAIREVPKYESSETQREVERLVQLVRSFELLALATEAPELAELNLSELMTNAVQSVRQSFRGYTGTIDIATEGEVKARGSGFLIDCIVQNGLRNAIEATLEHVSIEGEPSVVVTWGVTDRDAWIAIRDPGPGIRAEDHQIL